MSTFRPFQHQSTGIRSILARRNEGKGMVVADMMGMGKTYTTLKAIDKACYYATKTQPLTDTTLIICPLSLLEHWYRDSKLHLNNGKMNECIQIYHGTNRVVNITSLVVITTYDVVSRDYYKLTEINSPLHKIEWTNIILDEAHIIRNGVKATKQMNGKNEHRVGKACMALRKQFGYALSGTPFCNNITDVYSLLDFIGESRELIKEPEKDWMLRRCKDDHLGLPPCTEIVIFTCSTPEMDKYKLLYLKKGALATEKMSAGDRCVRTKAGMQVITCALRLRQLSNSPFLLPDVNINGFGAASIVKRSPKIAKVRELVVKSIYNGQKIVIFSKFVECLKLVYKALEPICIPLLFTGSMSRLERENVLTKFKENSHNYLLLISIDCGGVGLNLTEATIAIIMEPWYNPFTELQAQNRIDRIGQTQPTTVYRLVDNSIKSADIWVRGIQQTKTIEAAKVVSGLEQMTNSYHRGGDFSMRDFIELFLNIDDLKLSPIPPGFEDPEENENLMTPDEVKLSKKLEIKRNKPLYKIISKDGRKYKVKVTRKIINKQVVLSKTIALNYSHNNIVL
jgi:transcription termination factor 2